MILPQTQIEREFAALWQLRGRELDRWQRICRGAGIDERHGVLPITDAIKCSTAERMQQYESHAPPIAERAAWDAIECAGISADRITDLVVVSCTGFAAPGLDVALMKRLGLRETVRRTMIGFMGCFGAINGLRSAATTCAADPNAVTLVVCCELCSLHVRDDPRPDNQVACALFGDGAAAAIVGGEASIAASGAGYQQPEGRPLGRLTMGHSRLIANTESLMSWRMTDAGFAMTLGRDVPAVLRDAIRSFVDEARSLLPECAPGAGTFSEGVPRTIVPHPGGPGVLSAIEQALPTSLAPGIDRARATLRRFGNMSSGTVLFVLQQLLAEQGRQCRPAMMLAFGPGLTMESIMVR